MAWLKIVMAIPVTLAILVLLATLLFPSIEISRAEARRSQCRINLKQIGLALHKYHNEYNSFPPAYTVDTDGRHLHSWRALLLPYLDQIAVHKQIDFGKPWDDPANDEARTVSPFVYACPAGEAKPGNSTYLAITVQGGLFAPGTSTRMADIKDGPANTLLVVEVPGNRSVHWMAPTDLDATGFEELATDTKTNHPNGLHVLFADGSVRHVTLEELAKQGRKWVTISGRVSAN
jgi:prepilin-type processing-associated H-X9-DG protein